MNTTTNSTALSEESLQNIAGKYLTFKLESESCGIRVLQVREIIRLAPITRMPQMPASIKGVINLRGKIVPVVDLRLRFGLPEATATETSCIIVVQVARNGLTPLQMGIIVDAVEEVVNLSEADLEQTPDFGTRLDTEYILGMAKIKGAVKILLNIERVLVDVNASTPSFATC